MKKFNVFLLIAIAVVLNTASTYAQSVCSKNAKSVYFQSNQSVLNADHKKMIDEIIKTRKSEIYLEIKGHTDSVGSHEFNNKLSEKRAKAVADYIIANSKFNKKDIRVSFYGKNNPVNVNDLAKKTFDFIAQINSKNKISCQEIQIDCDWTKSTKDKYFYLLKKIKELSKKEISCTLRLYPYKYPEIMGVPPVDKAMLMCYNLIKPLSK